MQQLDEAVTAYAHEDPDSRITVVVDASFEHRIDETERETLREAMLNGEVVSPPAGAIGRGDAFVLRIAERTGAIVLSNDSFQEFHGEHPWLFDDGRLIGGKPVPGVGWIFTPRLPIRGPKSSAATAEKRARRDPESAPAKAAELAQAAKKAAKRTTKKAAPVVATTWPLVPTEPPPAPRRGRVQVDPDLSSAINEAVAEALDPPLPPEPAKVGKAAKATKTPAKKKKAAAVAKKDAAPKKSATSKTAADQGDGQEGRCREEGRRGQEGRAGEEERAGDEGRAGQEVNGEEVGCAGRAGPTRFEEAVLHAASGGQRTAGVHHVRRDLSRGDHPRGGGRLLHLPRSDGRCRPAGRGKPALLHPVVRHG